MKNYRFNIILLVVVIILIGCGSSSSKEGNGMPKTFVEQNGHLSVKGNYLVNEKGDKIVLKGVSYGWHNWWPRFYNASTVEVFTNNWKCNVVRAAMGVEPNGAYVDNPTLGIDCVTKVVDAAIANGIYVIIDWHSHGIRTEEAKEFFAKMATKYKGVPNVIYELFNEPVEDSWADVKAYSIEIIKTIRAIDSNNVILIGTPHWDQDIHLAADDPITEYNNLMYTLHFYAATHHQYLRDRGDYALGKGLPLFVSECAGMEASGDGPINHQEWDEWLKWMNKHSISWAAWSIADKEETCSMMYATASSKGPWESKELKEWGQIIRKELSGE
ncbi:glycoside hydrolase family 5 protein [Bacteroides sp. 519]|uniref:glycoside hydrolase family 5 protein n=1 Tax=Bacteroides sp. 519 TaxID=2302937 RepID=UPI0013D5712E|nr:glycoside hydrolase family 5 protein [Bacteroides sp. 519]NDV60013.1 glycoside hydrolase family 5 protein [Bacteroides sp. 519]